MSKLFCLLSSLVKSCDESCHAAKAEDTFVLTFFHSRPCPCHRHRLAKCHEYIPLFSSPASTFFCPNRTKSNIIHSFSSLNFLFSLLFYQLTRGNGARVNRMLYSSIVQCFHRYCHAFTQYSLTFAVSFFITS